MKINEKVLRRIIRREILKENKSFLSKLDNIKKSFKDKAFLALFDKMIPDGDTTASSKFRTWVRKNKTTKEIKKALKDGGITNDFTLSAKVSSKKYAKNKHVEAAFLAFGFEYIKSLFSSKLKSASAGNIDPEDININSKEIDSSKAVNRAEAISKELGIDPAFVYAVEKKESAFKPRVMAWNIHIMRNPEFYKTPDSSQVITDEQQKKLTRLGFPRKKSYYGNDAIKAFRKAFKVNPYGAIIAGAWGHYQVLGSFAITAYNNSPAEWMKAFNDDPEEYAIKSFITWVNQPEYNKKFINAANRGDYNYTTKKYFGSSTSAMGKEYKSLIASYVKEYRRKHGNDWKPKGAST